MSDKIRQLINDLDVQLKQLYEELDNIDSTHYARHSEIVKKINEKILEKTSLEKLISKD